VISGGGGGQSLNDTQHQSKYMILGMGLNQTLIKTRQGFRELRLDYEEQNYMKAVSRLIIIDQDGVLPMKGSRGNEEPYPHVLHILNDIAQDERNTVFVVSSSTKQQMHKWYA